MFIWAVALVGEIKGLWKTRGDCLPLHYLYIWSEEALEEGQECLTACTSPRRGEVLADIYMRSLPQGLEDVQEHPSGKCLPKRT